MRSRRRPASPAPRRGTTARPPPRPTPSASAITRPRPRDPPVTSATLPSSRNRSRTFRSSSVPLLASVISVAQVPLDDKLAHEPRRRGKSPTRRNRGRLPLGSRGSAKPCRRHLEHAESVGSRNIAIVQAICVSDVTSRETLAVWENRTTGKFRETFLKRLLRMGRSLSVSWRSRPRRSLVVRAPIERRS